MSENQAPNAPRVKKVGDGDTFELDTGEKIRLVSVDTPETAGHLGAETDRIGSAEARNALAEQLGDGSQLEITRYGKDKYGRTLADVSVAGRDVGASLIESGDAYNAYNPLNTEQSIARGEANRNAQTNEDRYRQRMAHKLGLSGESTLGGGEVFDYTGTGQAALNRGVNNTEATLFGFAQALGQALDIDMVERYGEEGVIRNVKQAMSTPAKLKSWDDVETLANFYTYVLEGFGEQAPGWALDLTAFVGTGGVAGAASFGAKKLAAAQVGKNFKRLIGEKAFARVIADPTLLHMKQGAKAGALSAMYAQGAGETQIEFNADGTEAPFTVLGTGALKTGLEFAPLAKMAGDVKALYKLDNIDTRNLTHVIGNVAQKVFGSTAAEASTEALQTVADKVAVAIHNGSDPFSAENLAEIKESAIKGGIVGGGMSAAANTLGAAAGFASSSLKGPAPIGPGSGDVPVQGAPVAESNTNSEPMGDLAAQFTDTANPESPAKAVFFSAQDVDKARAIYKEARANGQQPSHATAPDGSVMLSMQPGVAESWAESGFDPSLKEQLIGPIVQPKTEMSPTQMAAATVVQRVDESGNVVREQLATPDAMPQATAVVSTGASPTDTVVEKSAAQVLQERAAKNMAEDIGSPYIEQGQEYRRAPEPEGPALNTTEAPAAGGGFVAAGQVYTRGAEPAVMSVEEYFAKVHGVGTGAAPVAAAALDVGIKQSSVDAAAAKYASIVEASESRKPAEPVAPVAPEGRVLTPAEFIEQVVMPQRNGIAETSKEDDEARWVSRRVEEAAAPVAAKKPRKPRAKKQKPTAVGVTTPLPGGEMPPAALDRAHAQMFEREFHRHVMRYSPERYAEFMTLVDGVASVEEAVARVRAVSEGSGSDRDTGLLLSVAEEYLALYTQLRAATGETDDAMDYPSGPFTDISSLVSAADVGTPTIGGLLELVLDNSEVTGFARRVFTRLLSTPEFADSKVMLRAHPGYTSAGGVVLNPDTGAINLHLYAPGGQLSSRVFLHESVHLFTSRAINNVGKLTAKQKKSVADLEALFEYVKDASPSEERGEYYMTNLDEFIAEAMSNSSVQDKLGKLPYRGKNVFTRFVEALRSLLGIPETDMTALTEAIRIFDALIAKPEKTSPGAITDVQEPGNADRTDGSLRDSGTSAPDADGRVTGPAGVAGDVADTSGRADGEVQAANPGGTQKDNATVSSTSSDSNAVPGSEAAGETAGGKQARVDSLLDELAVALNSYGPPVAPLQAVRSHFTAYIEGVNGATGLADMTKLWLGLQEAVSGYLDIDFDTAREVISRFEGALQGEVYSANFDFGELTESDAVGAIGGFTQEEVDAEMRDNIIRSRGDAALLKKLNAATADKFDRRSVEAGALEKNEVGVHGTFGDVKDAVQQVYKRKIWDIARHKANLATFRMRYPTWKLTTVENKTHRGKVYYTLSIASNTDISTEQEWLMRRRYPNMDFEVVGGRLIVAPVDPAARVDTGDAVAQTMRSLSKIVDNGFTAAYKGTDRDGAPGNPEEAAKVVQLILPNGQKVLGHAPSITELGTRIYDAGQTTKSENTFAFYKNMYLEGLAALYDVGIQLVPNTHKSYVNNAPDVEPVRASFEEGAAGDAQFEKARFFYRKAMMVKQRDALARDRVINPTAGKAFTLGKGLSSEGYSFANTPRPELSDFSLKAIIGAIQYRGRGEDGPYTTAFKRKERDAHRADMARMRSLLRSEFAPGTFDEVRTSGTFNPQQSAGWAAKLYKGAMREWLAAGNIDRETLHELQASSRSMVDEAGAFDMDTLIGEYFDGDTEAYNAEVSEWAEFQDLIIESQNQEWLGQAYEDSANSVDFATGDYQEDFEQYMEGDFGSDMTGGFHGVGRMGDAAETVGKTSPRRFVADLSGNVASLIYSTEPTAETFRKTFNVTPYADFKLPDGHRRYFTLGGADSLIGPKRLPRNGAFRALDKSEDPAAMSEGEMVFKGMFEGDTNFYVISPHVRSLKDAGFTHRLYTPYGKEKWVLDVEATAGAGTQVGYLPTEESYAPVQKFDTLKTIRQNDLPPVKMPEAVRAEAVDGIRAEFGAKALSATPIPRAVLSGNVDPLAFASESASSEARLRFKSDFNALFRGKGAMKMGNVRSITGGLNHEVGFLSNALGLLGDAEAQVVILEDSNLDAVRATAPSIYADIMAANSTNATALDTPARIMHMDGRSVIVLKSFTTGKKVTNADRGTRLMSLAHELGHSITDRFLANLHKDGAVEGSEYAQVMADFEVARAENIRVQSFDALKPQSIEPRNIRDALGRAYRTINDPDLQTGYTETDVREFMADKIGAFLVEKARAQRNFSDGVAKRIAAAITKVYRAAAGQIRKLGTRFDTSPSVNAAMERMIADNVFAKKYKARNVLRVENFTPVASAKAAAGVVDNALASASLHPITEGIRKQYPVALENKYVKFVSNFLSGAREGFVPMLTADYQLRRIAADLADKFFQITSSGKGSPDASWFRGRDNQTAQWAGQWSRTWTGFYDAANHPPVHGVLANWKRDRAIQGEAEARAGAALTELSQADDNAMTHAEALAIRKSGGSTGAHQVLSEDASKVAEFLKAFHGQYLKPNMPTIGQLRTYFPRMYNTQALIENPEQFVAILQQHASMHPAQAEEIRMTIINGHGGYEFHMDDVVNATASGLEARNRRQLRNPGLAKALDEAGFMFPNKTEVLDRYIANAVKRGEFERQFGDYELIVNRSGMPIELDLRKLDGAEDWVRNAAIQQVEKYMALADLDTTGKPVKDLDLLIEFGFIKWIDAEAGYGWYRSDSKLVRALQAIESPVDRQRAKTIIDGYLGRLGADLNPQVRNTMGWLMVYQNYLTLWFSTFSSIADFAGPLIRAREYDVAWAGMKAALRTLRDPEQMRELRDILHVVNHRMTNTGLSEMYGMGYITDAQAKANETLFMINQQERLTNLSRTFAAAMGQEFLIRNAEKALNGTGQSQSEAQRYLREMNVDAETILRWRDAGAKFWTLERAKDWSAQDTADEAAVRSALRQFIDESIMRPNAAQRPVWASNPVYMLLWHMKSFFYSFGKTILNGVVREMFHNRQGQGFGRRVAPAVMMGLFLLPLAALGLELREIPQYEVFGATPPTDMQDGWETTKELISRSGMLGPLELAAGMLSPRHDGESRSALASAAGPVFDHIYKFISEEDWTMENVGRRSLPVFNQLPGFWATVY